MYKNKTLLIRTLIESTSACFKILFWWRDDWDYRKLTRTTECEGVGFGGGESFITSDVMTHWHWRVYLR